MKLRTVFVAVALFGGCDWDDDDDDFDGDLPPDDDDDEDPARTLRWDAPLAGLPGFEELAGDSFVRQTGGEPFTASVTLRGDEPGAVRPWHVHFGSCATGGDIVGDPAAYTPLTIDAAGVATSTARVDFPLDPELAYHVNIHLSPADLPTIIACGDLVLTP